MFQGLVQYYVVLCENLKPLKSRHTAAVASSFALLCMAAPVHCPSLQPRTPLGSDGSISTTIDFKTKKEKYTYITIISWNAAVKHQAAFKGLEHDVVLQDKTVTFISK